MAAAAKAAAARVQGRPRRASLADVTSTTNDAAANREAATADAAFAEFTACKATLEGAQRREERRLWLENAMELLCKTTKDLPTWVLGPENSPETGLFMNLSGITDKHRAERLRFLCFDG